MTALQELCKKLEGNIRKGWVDHFLALEKKQIAQAFSDGQYNGLNYYKGPLVTGNYYYQETYGEDGQKDPLPDEDIPENKEDLEKGRKKGVLPKCP